MLSFNAPLVSFDLRALKCSTCFVDKSLSAHKRFTTPLNFEPMHKDGIQVLWRTSYTSSLGLLQLGKVV